MDIDALCKHMSECSSSADNQLEKTYHPHASLFKNQAKIEEQRNRRKDEIEKYRSFKRANRLDDRRPGLEDEENSEISETSMDETALNTSTSSSVCGDPQRRRIPYNWRARIMEGEWFLEIPEDFVENYYMKLIPQGRHVVLVARRGSTRVYSRRGACIREMPTILPGGGVLDGHYQRNKYYTVIDAIMDKNESDFYILDVVAWKMRRYFNDSANDRFEFLETMVHEELEVLADNDESIRFHVVPSYNCYPEDFSYVMQQKPPYPTEGVFFYLYDAPYIFGVTLLVGWLKGYMVPDMFGIPSVHPDFLADMPASYSDVKNAVIEWNAKHYIWFIDENEEDDKAEKKDDEVETEGDAEP